MLFVIIALLFAAILVSGLVSKEARRERRRRRLLEAGHPVTATIKTAEPTGHKSGGLAEVTLELELEDGRRARAREAMTPAEQVRCRPGAEVKAKVAPSDDATLFAVVTRYR